MEFKLNNKIAERKNKEIYFEDGKTIKLFVPGHLKSFILNEALNQARVEENTDLNMPKLLAVTQVNGRWALVYDYAEGTPLDKLMDENPEKEDEYLEKFVDIQMEVLSKKVPLLNRIKDKFKRKLTEAENINENVRYDLLHRLEGMKNHAKLCHGDFNPSNIIIDANGNYSIIDWAHATQGNASADAARTYLLFSMQGKTELADKYLKLFSLKSSIEVSHIQRWIPIVAATQMTKGNDEEQNFLKKWVDVVDYE